MALRFYMDEHIPRAITEGLRSRGIDVLTAQEDGRANLRVPDPQLLARATELDRVLFTRDDDLTGIATRLQSSQTEFSGVIYVHPLRLGIGATIQQLTMVANLSGPEELRGQLLYLPP